MKHAQKKIVILGGCGYIGTVLSQYLLSKGFYVKVIDRQIYGNFLKQSKNPLYLGTVLSKPCNCNLRLIKSVGYVIEIAATPETPPINTFFVL